MTEIPINKGQHPLIAADIGDQQYCVGFQSVTAVEWGCAEGSMSYFLTVRVFKDGKLFSEHPFVNVVAVYYAKEPTP